MATAAGPARADRVTPESAAAPSVPTTVLGVLLGLLAGAELAVLECLLVPLHVGRWPLPVAVVLAVAGNVVLPRVVVRLTRARIAVLAPVLAWLVVMVVFGLPRAEGDVLLPGTWVGLAVLFLGTLAVVAGAATAVLPRRPAAAGDPGAGSPGRPKLPFADPGRGRDRERPQPGTGPT